MFNQVITERTKSTLAVLSKEKILKDCYLAGGTALALQLGHRLSFDLDFFTETDFERRKIIQRLEPFGLVVEREDWGTILGKIEDVKFSLFYYKYPLIADQIDYLGINIASLQDIAAMKIDAISSRGTKRDFTDLFFLIKKFKSLNELLGFYDQKYHKGNANSFHIIKSLTYFDDADEEEDPRMLAKDYSWENVKKTLKEKVRELF